MTTIKLVAADNQELVRIAFEGPPNARQVHPSSNGIAPGDFETLANVMMLALVTHVSSFHKEGEEVAIPIGAILPPVDDGRS